MFSQLVKIQEINEQKLEQNIKIIKNMMIQWSEELRRSKIDLSELRYTNETGFLNPKAQAYILTKNIEVITVKLEKAVAMMATQQESLSRVLLEKEKFVVFGEEEKERKKNEMEEIYENEMDDIIAINSVYVGTKRKR